ncbi:MAG TPA: hypothetical protein VGR12_00315, partial [Solirubrobacteraceae bacterium]|nr:hypothetical protein [Solirubrobacteraceae bacterium]
RHLAGRFGGFDLTDHGALERDPSLAARYDHLVVLDPPPYDGLAAAPGPMIHLAFGEPEREFALRAHEHHFGLRESVAAVYRSLRAGEPLERFDPAVAARALTVLEELGLVDGLSVHPAPERTQLEASAAYRAYTLRLEDGRRWLSQPTATEATAAAAA